MKDSNAGFHLGNLIKKHIYFRNKSVKEVAMHLDLNEKTFSDHLNKSKMLSDELFDIADYLELSLDYIGSMSKNKPGLLGQKVCRLNKTSHNKANELVSCEIKKIKSTDEKDVNNIITELKKTYNGLGYVIDALLPLDDSGTGVPYQIYVKDSRVRGNINSGEYVIWPPVGKELDIEDYEEFLNGQAGIDYVKSLLKGTVGKVRYDYIKNDGLDIEKIHLDYESINEDKIWSLWSGSRVIANNRGEIICAKPSGPGRRRFSPSEYSRAEYYYILGMKNLEAKKYYDALVDFNTAAHIYYNDTIFVDSQFYEGLYKVATDRSESNPLSIFDLCNGRVKVLKKFGLYKNIINDVLKVMDTNDYKEIENERYTSSCDIMVELNKNLLYAYIKEKQFLDALNICDRLLEIVDLRGIYNIIIVKSLVLEQMESYNEALKTISVYFDISNLVEDGYVNDDFVKEFQYESTQANRLRKRLVQTMKDKGIAIEVKGFFDDEDEE